jgi:2-iminobutanoate/2-iminopropanoate deaminase
MSAGDIVKVGTSLVNAADVAAYAKVRGEILGDARPAFMLQIVSGFIWPNVLVEIEVIAAAR